MHILFIDSNHPSLHETLQKAGHVCDLNYHWTREDILNNIHLYDGVVIRSRIRIDKEFIDKAINLKFIARAGAGMENIDVPYAEKKGIKCFHAPEGNRDAVAEHAMGMILSLFNNLNRADRQVREGKWIREGNRGIELMNKTVGIIGYGNMGSAFAERLVGMKAFVLAYDKYRKGFGTDSIWEADLERIFSEAHIVSLHVPLSPETENMVKDDFINRFKNDIYLINTSRGKCVNTEDLVKNLKSGKIKGACLDVLEYEMSSFESLNSSELPPAFQYLTKCDNVILSPHIAGWTHESNAKIAGTLASKIIRFLG
jgi:D-3-phosphoglycerate dehydrogenase